MKLSKPQEFVLFLLGTCYSHCSQKIKDPLKLEMRKCDFISLAKKAGLVNKIRSSKDQRVVHVTMRPAGEQVLRQASQVWLKEAHDTLGECLSSEELGQLGYLLRKVRNHGLKRLGIELEPVADEDRCKRLVD